jgi:hypothetical protein
MTEFKFDPPLQLAGTPKVMIRTLDESADFVRAYKGTRRPMVQDSVLHRVIYLAPLGSQQSCRFSIGA